MKTTQLLETIKQIYPITRNEISKLLNLDKTITAVTVKFCQGPSDRNVHFIHLEDDQKVIMRRVLDRAEHNIDDEDVLTYLNNFHDNGFSIDGSIYVNLRDAKAEKSKEEEEEAKGEERGASENLPEQTTEPKQSEEDTTFPLPVIEDAEEAKNVAEATGTPVITAVQKPKRKHGKSRFKKKKLLEEQQKNGIEPTSEQNVQPTEKKTENGEEEV